MDDWFSLVLLFLFIILPLIQQVIGQVKKGDQEDETAILSEESGEFGETPLEVEPQPKRIDKPDSGSWSETWTPWPEETRQSSAPAPPPAPQAAEQPIADPRVRQVEIRPLPDHRVRPVEIRPLPDPHPQSIVISLENVTPRETVRSPVDHPRLTKPSVVHAHAQRLAVALPRGSSVHAGPRPTDVLFDHAGIRRAVILNEVLAPPVGLRDPE